MSAQGLPASQQAAACRPKGQPWAAERRIAAVIGPVYLPLPPGAAQPRSDRDQMHRKPALAVGSTRSFARRLSV